MEAAAWIT